MKIITKFTYILLICAMMLGCMPFSIFAAEPDTQFTLPAPGPECFEYTLNADKTAVITKYSGDNSFVAIPDMIDGYKVVSVGSGVFKDHKEIRRVDFGSSVVRIESSAFASCTALEEIILPNSVEFIGASAFSGCTSLYYADSGNSLVSLGSGAFSGCTSLESISLPQTLTSIGDSAFESCTALRSVVIASSTAQISKNAFAKTSGITVYAPDVTVNSYKGNEAKLEIAAGAEALSVGTAPSGVTITAFRSDAKAIIIPNKINGKAVVGISDGAFSGKTALEAVFIPDSVKTVGKQAFSGDTALKYVRMPREMTVGIPTECFEGCSSLTRIYISSGVETVGAEAFSGCSALKVVTFPASLSRLQTGAFYGASSLRALIFKGDMPSCTFYNGLPDVVSLGSAPADMKIYTDERLGWSTVWYPNGNSGYTGYSVTSRSHDCFFVENMDVYATCAIEGKSTYICRVCGDSYGKTYPTTEHIFVSLGQSNGVEAFRCTGCVLNYTIKLLDIATVAVNPDLSQSGADIVRDITVSYRGTVLTEGVDFVCEREYFSQHNRIILTIKGIGEYGGELTQGYSSLTGTILNTYNLTVIGASGSGVYYRDDRVTLIPSLPTPEGKEAVWSCDNGRFLYADNDRATLEMPAKDVVVTLTYKDAPVTEPPVTTPPVTTPPVTTPPITEPPVTEPPVTTPPETIPPETETQVPETTRPPYSDTEVGQSYLTKAMIWAFVLLGSLAVFVVLIILTFKGNKKQ